MERPVAGKAYAVFFGDARGNAYAIEAATGKQIWKGASRRTSDRAHHRRRSRFRGPRLCSGGFRRRGKWRCRGNLPVLYFPGSVVALNAETGRQVWKTYTIADEPKPTTKNATGTQLFAPSGAGVWNSPTIDAKRRALYVGTGNAYSAPGAPTTDALIAMDLDSGKILWSVQETQNDVWLAVCRQNPGPNCGPDHDFGSPPMLRTLPDGSTILVAGQKSGNVWAHDPDKKGAVVWRTPLVDDTTVFGGKLVWGGAADEQNAYFGLGPGGIAAVQLRDGQKKWFMPLRPAAGSSSACRTGGRVERYSRRCYLRWLGWCVACCLFR